MPKDDVAMPRWVKVLVVALVLGLVALTVLLVAGGEEHGPSRHGAIERSLWS